MTTIIMLSITGFVVGGFFLYSRKNKSTNTSSDKKPFLNRQEAESVVKRLVDLGYYKYADPKDVNSLKEDLVSSIAEYGILSTIYFDEPITPKDFRYYLFDGEAVYEQGGFTDILQDMQGTFDKIGLKLKITNHIEEYDTVTKGVNHELTVNGKRYIIFKNFKDYGWGEAVQKFAEMINDQLEIQNKDERLYLINGGNDGTAVFLTDQQFQLLDKLSTDDQWKPLKVDKWCEVFKVIH